MCLRRAWEREFWLHRTCFRKQSTTRQQQWQPPAQVNIGSSTAYVRSYNEWSSTSNNRLNSNASRRVAAWLLDPTSRDTVPCGWWRGNRGKRVKLAARSSRMMIGNDYMSAKRYNLMANVLCPPRIIQVGVAASLLLLESVVTNLPVPLPPRRTLPQIVDDLRIRRRQGRR